jgi:hypothetical protein
MEFLTYTLIAAVLAIIALLIFIPKNSREKIEKYFGLAGRIVELIGVGVALIGAGIVFMILLLLDAIHILILFLGSILSGILFFYVAVLSASGKFGSSPLTFLSEADWIFLWEHHVFTVLAGLPFFFSLAAFCISIKLTIFWWLERAIDNAKKTSDGSD